MRLAAVIWFVLLAQTALTQAASCVEQGNADYEGAFCVATDFPQSEESPEQPANIALHTWNFTLEIVRDQRTIWISPFQLREPRHWRWLAPLMAGTGVVLLADRPISKAFHTAYTGREVAGVLGTIGDPTTLFGVTGLAWLMAHAADRPYAAETALLGMEALLATSATTRILKIAAGRQRPLDSDARTRFWKGGRSFPSGHAMNIWALAEVVAARHRDRPWLRWGMYALASSISVSRVIGSNHFPSDVLVGGSVGYLIGRFVRFHLPRR